MILFSRLNILFVAVLLILQTLPSNALPPDLPEGDIVFISSILTQDPSKAGRSKTVDQFHLNILNLQTQEITQRYPLPFNRDSKYYSPVFTVLPDQKSIWINLSPKQIIVDLKKQTISPYTPEIEKSFENFSTPLTGAHHEYTILYPEKTHYEKTPYLFNLMSNEKSKPIPYEKNFDFFLMLPTPNQALFVHPSVNAIDIVNILTGKILSPVQASIPIMVNQLDFSLTPNGEVLTILGGNTLHLKNLKDDSESKILIKRGDHFQTYTKINMISDRYGIVANLNTLYLLDTHKEGINLTEIFRLEGDSHCISPHETTFLAFIPRPQKTLFNKSNIGEIPSLSDLEIHTVQ